MIPTLHQILFWSSRENEMSRVFGVNGREETCIHSFGGETPREGDHMDDLGVDGRIILK
jgi:hypothetical protein